MTQENSLLGKFHLNEIPPMPHDALEIGDTFAIDANGCPGQVWWCIQQDHHINEKRRLSQDTV